MLSYHYYYIVFCNRSIIFMTICLLIWIVGQSLFQIYVNEKHYEFPMMFALNSSLCTCRHCTWSTIFNCLTFHCWMLTVSNCLFQFVSCCYFSWQFQAPNGRLVHRAAARHCRPLFPQWDAQRVQREWQLLQKGKGGSLGQRTTRVHFVTVTLRLILQSSTSPCLCGCSTEAFKCYEGRQNICKDGTL